MKRTAVIIMAGIIVSCATTARGSEPSFEGTVKLGGVAKDENGNRAVMQETFNVHEGFSVSAIRLNSRPTERSVLRFDLNDINRDNRNGYLEYRIPGMLRVYSRYAQSQYVFDAARATESERRDFDASVRYTPVSAVQVTADYGLQRRSGDRIGFPDSVGSALGDRYDTRAHRGRLEAQLALDRAGGSVAFEGTRLRDDLSSLNDREGRVLSATVHLPGIVFDRLTHVARGAFGQSELPNAGDSGLEYKLYMVQYTGIVAPRPRYQLKYRFYGSRVDDDATAMKTDNYIHDVDGRVRFGWGTAAAGYGWESLDNDRSVTTYHNLRGSVSAHTPGKKISGSVEASSRTKDDLEKLTLLQDNETLRTRVRADIRPTGDLALGGSWALRNRDLPDIEAEIDGQTANAYVRYGYEYFGDIGVIGADATVSYTFGDDDYTNREGAFHTRSHFVSAMLDADYEDKIKAGAGVTFMDIGGDLDIEKSVLMFRAGYVFAENWEASARYNIYNYDDYIVRERFYTANVVWFDVGYHFNTE